jgi:type IV secretion system protein VirB4
MSPLALSFGIGARLTKTEAAIGDRVPYARHIDDVTLLTRDGLLVQTLKLDGFPFETADDQELNYRKQVRETLLRGVASSRLSIYHHVVRRLTTPRLEGRSDDPFCDGLDQAWRERLSSRQLFVNDLYLTLVHRPLQGRIGALERLFRSAGQDDANLKQDLRRLHSVRENFVATLSPYGAKTLSNYRDDRGEASEPCSFLAQLLNGELRRIAQPEGDIGQVIADRRLTFGLDAMEIAAAGARPRQFAAMVSIKDYPARSAPGLLDGVLRLPCELTLTESFSFVDRQIALDRMGLTLRRLRAADDDAFSLRTELAAARDEVGAGRAAYGEHHLSILVRADSLDALDGAVADVQSALTEAGGVAVREDINLEPAFWAQFPGNFRYIARKALISAANFSSFASFHNHASGQAEGNHWGPAVTVLETTAHGPYYFNFHNGDLGNFTVIGPSGSGKTVLITFLLAQARKFDPRTIYFDKDRGAEAFIRASGGTYSALRPGQASGLNPLQIEDTPPGRAFLTEWLAQLLGGADGLTVEELAMVADAVDANFDQPPNHRRLRYLRELFVGTSRPRGGDLAARLRPWCEGGEHAWLFDNATDEVSLDQAVYGFDMTRLLDTPVTRTPAMLYLFHRIEQGLDGRPTIIVVDEGWKALDDEVFTRRLKDWEKTIRKRNGVVGFCTQSASDALESRIASAIVEQAATQIFLPNSKARAGDYIEGFGLTPHEFELVRTLPDTSRCFLIKQADHSVVARLDLTGLEGPLKVLAGTERSVRRLDQARATAGDDPAAWMPVYLAEVRGGRS